MVGCCCQPVCYSISKESLKHSVSWYCGSAVVVGLVVIAAFGVGSMIFRALLNNHYGGNG
jgi:hypothetical protein